ncbi:MAG TPA: pyridoxal phosphate-dependent aminotransferase [Bacteroidia bacterium]|nr:pyridoxal phosphate-dependent aminotransferase [Bacteroidia bacterium]HRH08616.1 pyridoxal phosphate-dependent aminotransferase [Bacteroidia bacterium]HRH62405.1 pyridoxal phosphate-dependent aminotransferase [Bacteroidia bacterium]
MTKLSERHNNITEPQTLAMARISRELQAKGIDVISLSIGEPDFDTPDFIKEAAKKAIDNNFSHYTPVPGYLDLREAICTKFKRDNGLTYSPDEIVVSTGAKQSIANVILALIDKDDEVIIPTPYWVSYSEQVKLADGKVVFIPSTVESNFKISADQLQKAITPKTKLMIFSTPCNPSGAVYTKAELKAFADVIAQHPNLFVISDEIYEHINFIGKHESLAQFDAIRNQVITVNGVSKGFAMTGWRIGYIGAPKWIAKACEKMQGQFTSGTSSIAQRAAMAAVLADPAVTQQMCKAFKKRRDLVVSLLRDIPGIKANVPDGAFYVFPDISSYFGKRKDDLQINNSHDLSMYLLHTANVALVSGDAFGDDNCVRFSYATSEEKLIEALKRVKAALALLN